MGRALHSAGHRVLSRKNHCYYWASHSTFPSLRFFIHKIEGPALIHPFNTRSLNSYYVPGPVLGRGDTAIHATDSIPHLRERTF